MMGNKVDVFEADRATTIFGSLLRHGPFTELLGGDTCQTLGVPELESKRLVHQANYNLKKQVSDTVKGNQLVCNVGRSALIRPPESDQSSTRKEFISSSPTSSFPFGAPSPPEGREGTSPNGVSFTALYRGSSREGSPPVGVSSNCGNIS
ncbi:hypothetical protein EYF80_040314 [Liparis tanakae]|uniref:Uncharacterized protein n=1 Tax=Liparis tanakae TaxID=230148 RepID=A0A4Z2G949_9TELE|nr:hypothetical protein EYF80_040314 [Liparis tanakae]